MVKERGDKDSYYMNIAREVAARSTCFRARHGAVIIRDDQIIATGYVGAPRNTMDCLERDNCLRQLLAIPSGQRYELCRSVHAEQNAVINAARAGVSLLKGTMYLFSEKICADGDDQPIDSMPCFICKKIIINSGLERLVGRLADGSLRSELVSDWAKNWQTSDLLDDKEQYGEKFKQ